MKTIVLIDGNSLLNRAFYALPLLTNSNGEYSNAVYGFTKMMLGIIEKVKPEKIVVAFDYGKKNFRHKLFKDYKGTRKGTPEELSVQFPIMKRLLSSMNIKLYEKEGIEADDIIGTIAKNTNDYKKIIYSGDKDLLQLVDENTEVWLTKKGTSETEEVTILNIKEKYGFTPSQVIDMKALMGDKSDNIPGVMGIGEKTALNLLETYENLDGVYNNLENIKGSVKQKLLDNKEMAYLSHTLATIKTDCDININEEEFDYDFPFKEETYKIFKEYEFKTLLNKAEFFEHEVETYLEKLIPCQTIKIQTKDKLNEVIKYVEDTKQIAFEFGKRIEFAFSPNFLYQISKEITFFDELNEEDVITALKPILENPNIKKIVYDRKANQKIAKCNIVGDVFEIDLAKYVLFEKNTEDLSCNEYFSIKEECDSKMNLLGVKGVYDNIEKPLVDVLIEMETNGFKIDINELNELSLKFNKERDSLIKEIYDNAGREFNLNSPKQLAEVLYDDLKIPTTYNKKRSTALEVLEKLVDYHPIVKKILKYRKVNKLVSTYIDVYKELYNKNGDIIHTIFNQTLTNTGRLSSSEPNLQNIPIRTEYGKELRKIFVSRFDGGELISSDYSQIELKILANLSKDENLIKAYKSGTDIHTWTASRIFNMPIEFVDKEFRDKAKAVNFGIVYGISDFGLAENIKSTREEAKEIIETYFERFKGIKLYMDSTVEKARKDGYVSTYFGRIRRIPEISSTNYNERTSGERIAMNMPLQGTASDVLKLAMINVYNEFKKQNLKSLLILTIHDEIIVDAVKEEIETVKNILKNEMENVIKFEIPLTVEIGSGKTWDNCK